MWLHGLPCGDENAVAGGLGRWRLKNVFLNPEPDCSVVTPTTVGACDWDAGTDPPLEEEALSDGTWLLLLNSIGSADLCVPAEASQL